MKDELEKYIADHRNEFDKDEPGPQVWKGIISRTPRKQNLWWSYGWKVAAAILIFATAWYLHDINDTPGKGPDKLAVAVKETKAVATDSVKDKTSGSVSVKQIAEVKKDSILQQKNTADKKSNHHIHTGTRKKQEPPAVDPMSELNVYYASLINSRKNEIFRFASGNPEIYKEVNAEIKSLDKAFKELQQDLRDNVNNQQVVEAMVQNYRTKLAMLETLLNQLKKSGYEDNSKTEIKSYGI